MLSSDTATPLSSVVLSAQLSSRKWDAIVGVFSAEVKLWRLGRDCVEPISFDGSAERRPIAPLERTAFLPYPESNMSRFRLRQYSRAPIVSGLSILTALLTAASLLTAEPSPRQQAVAQALNARH